MSDFPRNMFFATLFIALFSYFLYEFGAERSVIIETKNIESSYDSIYVASLEQNNNALSQKYLLTAREKQEYEKKYKELLEYIRNQKPDTVRDYRVDTLVIEKEKKPVYSSNFSIGSDTLNATGIVAFDFSRFYFSNVNFRYPQRTITKIKFVEKTNWTWVAVGAAVGVVIGAVVK